MLERTAAGLESCNLQRVLPRTVHPAKRTARQLHTAFWQHGAAAIEISTIWPPSLRSADGGRGSCGDAGVAPSLRSSNTTGLVASAFLLDFLYPSGTYKLLKRLYPGLGRQQVVGHAIRGNKRRNLTSSSLSTEASSSRGDGDRYVTERVDDGRTADGLRGETPLQTKDETPFDSDVLDAEKREKSHDDREREASKGVVISKRSTLARKRSTPPTITELLDHADEERYNEIWDLYCRLDDHQQAEVRRDMVIYFSKSSGIVEMGRAISLFRQIHVESWDDDLLEAGLLALVRSGDLDHAIDRLKAGLELNGLTGGLEYVLADLLINRKWSQLISVWLEFYTKKLWAQPELTLDSFSLHLLESLPNLEKLCLSFEEYLSSDAGAKSVRAINLYPDLRAALEELRQKVARLALLQPCEPKQASIILDMCNDHQLYSEYLARALEKWDGTPELKSNIAWITDLYTKYRSMPGFQPPISLLKGMFTLFYPYNAIGIAHLHTDWIQTFDKLDQWGYEKYLKYYAFVGNVDAVKKLWVDYIATYPKVLKKPRAFRSTMNAYAQVGDAMRAEQELRDMTEKYGVKPDIDIWNTILKCYMRAEDYHRAAACFDEICNLYKADSYTYAHVMALSARRGDLETTLKYFRRSQVEKVAVSREMVMSVVLAYCRNDLLLEAEQICTELAERKVTSTAIWNQLIYFNGMQGKLNKCYELLQSMKKFDLTWDHQTHECILQALTRVDQIQPAYRLLQSACEQKLFPVGPEHFAIVMDGAVRVGSYGLVDSMAAQLARRGQLMNFNAQVALVEAAFKKFPSARRTRQLGRQFTNYLRSLMAGRNHPDHDQGTPTILQGDVRHLERQTRSIGRAIRLLVKMRDFKTIEEVVNAYTTIFPRYRGSEPLPPDVVAAVMLGYLNDRKFSQIHHMWNQTWENVLHRSWHHQDLGIFPAYQYNVSRPITLVIKAFRQQNNGRGLLECVERVTSVGFRLTRSNWNLLIRSLAEMSIWEPAMRWCEMMLMPRWRGWKPGKRSLQERRQLMNTRELQAVNVTIISLQPHWLKLRKLAAWSPQVSSQLRDIERRYPRLHHAFTTVDMDHLPSRGRVRAEESLRKTINEALKPFSYVELKAMRRALERQLRLERSKRKRTEIRDAVSTLSREVKQRGRVHDKRPVLKGKSAQNKKRSKIPNPQSQDSEHAMESKPKPQEGGGEKVETIQSIKTSSST